MSPTNVLGRCSQLIERKLGFSSNVHLGHKNDLAMVGNDFGTAQVVELLSDLYTELSGDLRELKKRTSKENWRFKLCTKIASKNRSPETRLEKALAQGAGHTHPGSRWANQVPTASGLFKSTSAVKKNVDIVRRRTHDSSYDFVELKVASDTPLYAAFEILLNGVLYLLARKLCVAKETRGFNEHSPLLEASEIHLCVLAPEMFYEACDVKKLKSIEKAINEGL